VLQRGLMPFVVASQTIPILAVAPMVVIGLSNLGMARWGSVAFISAYLSFFPVTINALRGLTSVPTTARELFASYAASRLQTLRLLSLPNTLPYLFTALKVSATASVVGAIIGELPSGIPDGLGAAILNFNQYYNSAPPNLWATILVAAALGIVFYSIVAVAERIVIRWTPPDRAKA
jgi:NitT/TauT family transport system permease protein